MPFGVASDNWLALHCSVHFDMDKLNAAVQLAYFTLYKVVDALHHLFAVAYRLNPFDVISGQEVLY